MPLTLPRRATLTAVLFALAGVAPLACSARDVKTSGPLVSLRGTNVSDAAPIPANGVVDLAFDRYLLPSSISGAFVLKDADGASPTFVVEYNPVTLAVRLRGRGGAWLTPGKRYTLDVGALQAIDGAALAPVTPIQFTATDAAAVSFEEPLVQFCRDVQPIFKQRCSAASCHGAPAQTGPSDRFGPQGGITLPAEGLILETSLGLYNTARNQVAHTTNIGSGTSPDPSAKKFGVDMAIIAPGDPGASLLMYKVLLPARSPANTPPSTRDRCSGGSVAPLPPFASSFAPITDGADEREVLGSLIRGREMPYLSYGPQPDNLPLTTDELERVRAWIAQGAKVDECGVCEK